MNVSDFESPDTLRIAIRKELDSLHAGEILTTRNLVERIMARCKGAPAYLEKLLYQAVRTRPVDNFPGYATYGDPRPGKGWSKGKMVRPVLWRRATVGTCTKCKGSGVIPLDTGEGHPISMPEAQTEVGR